MLEDKEETPIGVERNLLEFVVILLASSEFLVSSQRGNQIFCMTE